MRVYTDLSRSMKTDFFVPKILHNVYVSLHINVTAYHGSKRWGCETAFPAKIRFFYNIKLS